MFLEFDYNVPYKYYDPAARQGMSLSVCDSGDELVHTDGALFTENLLSIVKTGNTVMLLYKGQQGHSFCTASNEQAADLEAYLKTFITNKILTKLGEHYRDLNGLSIKQLPDKVDCLYYPQESLSGWTKPSDVLIVEGGLSRQRYDLMSVKVRQRFLSDCVTDSTTF